MCYEILLSIFFILSRELEPTSITKRRTSYLNKKDELDECNHTYEIQVIVILRLAVMFIFSHLHAQSSGRSPLWISASINLSILNVYIIPVIPKRLEYFTQSYNRAFLCRLKLFSHHT